MSGRPDPTPDELHRYAVAWGHADAALLTDWRMWEQRYNAALEVIRAMSVRLDAAVADATRLRERATLSDAERTIVDDAMRSEHPAVHRLLRVIARFTEAENVQS